MAARKGAGTVRSLPLLKTWRRYLAPSNDSYGSTMVKPGERGYGIIPWVMDIAGCDCCSHPLHQLTGGDPLFSPAFVTWVSPLDTSEELRKDVVKQFDLEEISGVKDDVTTPMLQVDELVFPDMHCVYSPTKSNQGLADDCYDKILIPTWSVTPVSEKLFRSWSMQSRDHWFTRFPWLDILGTLTSGEPEYFHNGNEACFDEDHPEYVENVCQCGNEEAFEDMRRDFNQGMDFTEGITHERNAFEDAYGTAMDRLRYGWQLCFERHTEGDESSQGLGGWWSPYWRVDAMRAKQKYTLPKQVTA